MGAPAPRRGLRRLNDSLLTRLLRGLPGVDVRIVADPTLRRQTSEAGGQANEANETNEANEAPIAERVPE
jgi:hypothetical protein